MSTPPIHPAAELFPLMGDDELQALAADIKENGLRQPITLDGDGRLLDGRNRLTACKIAGVEPEFVSVNGADPVALSVSLNVKRRNLSKSQVAIAAAQAAGAIFGPTLTRADRDGIAEQFGTSKSYIQQARALLTRAPDLAEAVKAGTLPLADAYEELRGRERANQKRDQVLTELRSLAPDLADAAEEGRLKLNEAVAASDERERKRREDIEIATANVTRALDLLPESIDPDRLDLGRIDNERVAQAAAVLCELGEVLK